MSDRDRASVDSAPAATKPAEACGAGQAAEPRRQTGVGVEVTPAMAEAGAEVLQTWVGIDRFIGWDEKIVARIYRVMEETSRADPL